MSFEISQNIEYNKGMRLAYMAASEFIQGFGWTALIIGSMDICSIHAVQIAITAGLSFLCGRMYSHKAKVVEAKIDQLHAKLLE